MKDDSGAVALRGRGRPTHREVYRRLQIQVDELRDRLGGLPLPEEAGGIWRDIWYEEAHHSTAIEGNTLVLKQVERLLDEGRAVGNKELSEYLEVKGYACGCGEGSPRSRSAAGRSSPTATGSGSRDRSGR